MANTIDFLEQVFLSYSIAPSSFCTSLAVWQESAQQMMSLHTRRGHRRQRREVTEGFSGLKGDILRRGSRNRLTGYGFDAPTIYDRFPIDDQQHKLKKKTKVRASYTQRRMCLQEMRPCFSLLSVLCICFHWFIWDSLSDSSPPLTFFDTHKVTSLFFYDGQRSRYSAAVKYKFPAVHKTWTLSLLFTTVSLASVCVFHFCC